MKAIDVARVQRAAALSVVATSVVVAVKLVAAWLSGSVSVLAEGLQSTVDILMALLALLTVRYAAQPPDEDHPYGHGKAELLAGAFQMILMIGSAIFILVEAYHRWLKPEPITWNWGAAAMAYTLVSNVLVSIWIRRVANETNSAVLASEVQHLKGDTLSSAGVLVGLIIFAFTGRLWVDPLVAALFTVVAMIGAAQQLRSVLHPLMDGALPAAERKKLETVLDTHPEVRGYHNLRTRLSGSARVVELHVMLDDAMSFVAAHETAEHIEDDLRKSLGGNVVVSIHYEPYEAELEHRRREHGEIL